MGCVSDIEGAGSAGAVTDEELVRRVTGDPGSPAAQRASAELFGRYRRRVYIWCFRYIGNHETAMDLAQDVLLNAYRSLGSFQGDCRFSSWIYAIARNRCFNELRRPAIFAEEPVEDGVRSADREDPAERMVQRFDEERLLALIHRHLDLQEQAVLWLRCFERMPIETITTVMAIQQSSGARGVLQRARRKLRSALQRECKGGEIRP